jgi:hypothetical protein
MPTDTELCNLALSHIGARNISIIGEATKEGRECAKLYDPARRHVLRGFSWGFAEQRTALALLSGVTPVGYTYAYEYPVKCLKARKIWKDESDLEPIDFIINVGPTGNSKVIYTNEASAVLIFTYDVTNTSIFDPEFDTLFSWKLASDLAIPITKKRSTLAMALNTYSIYSAEAKQSDAQEQSKQENRDKEFNTYVDARN